jgi:hypothetical protein
LDARGESQVQVAPASSEARKTPLICRYVAGETARYTMTGSHQGREFTVTYTAECESTVKRDAKDRFIEEFRWTRLNVAGQDTPLDEVSRNFRQVVSLDPEVELTPPDITGINPMLIGPVFDLMTFYVDLHPSLHQGKLKSAGDRVHVAHGEPNSWADGTNVILGEDCIDFELTLSKMDDSVAVLNVRHVPPAKSTIKLPAAWMQERVKPDSPNNWVQVQRDTSVDPPRFVAATGHEIFDVMITVDRHTGAIVTATMDNPVDVIQRHCNDEALTDCGEPVKFQIRRRIELRRIATDQ